MGPDIAKWSLLALALSAAVVGAGAAFTAWLLASPGMGLGAAILLLWSPSLAVIVTAVPAGCTPSGDVFALANTVDRLHRVERSLRFTRGARAVALTGLSYAVVLSICESTGLIAAPGFVLSYSLLSLAAVLAYLPWLARRESSALALRATLSRSVDEFKARRGWDTQ